MCKSPATWVTTDQLGVEGVVLPASPGAATRPLSIRGGARAGSDSGNYRTTAATFTSDHDHTANDITLMQRMCCSSH